MKTVSFFAAIAAASYCVAFVISMLIWISVADAHPKQGSHCHVTSEGCHD